MTVTPSDEERSIQEVARGLFADRAPLEKQAAAGPGARRELVREMAGLDFFAQALPEDAGGLGLSPLASGLIAEAGGRQLAPGLWLDQLVATHVAAGSDQAGAIAAADQLVAIAVTESPASLAVDGTGVHGQVHGVRYGDEADSWLLLLPDRAVLVDPRGAGVDSAAEPEGIDPLGRSTSARFAGAPPLAEWSLPPGEAGLRRALAGGLAAAFAIGAAQRVLDEAIAYVKDRRQFGVPIGSFQAIKHRAANAYIANLHARSLVYGSLSAADEHRLRVARIAADGAYRQAAQSALQMHGGIGFTSEANVHLFLKNAEQLRNWPCSAEADHAHVREHLQLDTPVAA